MHFEYKVYVKCTHITVLGLMRIYVLNKVKLFEVT